MATFRQAVTASAGISVINLLGKVLSLVKVLVLAAIFGASGPLDAFWAAMILPTLFPTLARNLLVAAFVPRFMSDLRATGEADGWDGANTLFSTVVLFAFALTALLIVFPGAAVSIVAPGLDSQTHGLATGLTRTLAVVTLLAACVNSITAIKHAQQRFTVVSLEGLVVNAVTISCVILLAESHGIYSMAYGVILGYGLQGLLLLASDTRFLAKTIRIRFQFRHPDFLAPLQHMVPLAVGFAGAIMITIADNFFASFLGEGSISALNYGQMIAMLPVQVFAVAIVTVFYPIISKEFADDNKSALVDLHLRGLRLLMLVIIPCSGVLVVFAHDIVALLLERREFTAEDTRLTMGVVAAFGAGLLGHVLMIYNFRTLNAVLKTWKQVRLGLIGAGVNVVCNALLYRLIGVTGIALGTTIAVSLVGYMSTRAVERELAHSLTVPVFVSIGKMLVMTLGLVATGILWAQAVETIGPGFAGQGLRIVRLAGLIPGIAVFFALGQVLGVQASRRILEAARGKLLGEQREG